MQNNLSSKKVACERAACEGANKKRDAAASLGVIV
jgi:hypothetical protein